MLVRNRNLIGLAGYLVLFVIVGLLGARDPSILEMVLLLWVIITTVDSVWRAIPMRTMRTGWIRVALGFAGIGAAMFLAPLSGALMERNAWGSVTPAHLLFAMGGVVVGALLLHLFSWVGSFRNRE